MQRKVAMEACMRFLSLLYKSNNIVYELYNLFDVIKEDVR